MKKYLNITNNIIRREITNLNKKFIFQNNNIKKLHEDKYKLLKNEYLMISSLFNLSIILNVCQTTFFINSQIIK